MAFLLYLILRIAAQAAFVEEFFFGEAEVRLAASAGRLARPVSHYFLLELPTFGSGSDCLLSMDKMALR